MRTVYRPSCLMLCLLLVACASQPSQPSGTLAAPPGAIDSHTPDAKAPTFGPAVGATVTMTSYQDIAFYGEDLPDVGVDIYLPADRPGPYPTVVYLPPPMAPEKAAMRAYAPHLVEQGYAAVAIGIRPTHLSVDSFCGLAWVHANAKTYGLDTKRIVVFGISGSGFPAALVAAVDHGAQGMLPADCPYPQPEGSWVQGVVTYEAILGTPVSFASSLVRSDSAYVSGMSYDETAALYDKMIETPPADWPGITGLNQKQSVLLQHYALYWIDGSEPPFMLIYGSLSAPDLPWMEKEQLWFADYLQRAGVPVEVVRKEGFTHTTTALVGHTEEMDAFLKTLFERPATD